MAEIVGVELNVNKGNTDVTVKSIRAQLKEATADLIRMQEQFGDISPEAQKAAKAVAGLRDQIGDAAEVAALFDPGKTFGVVVGAAQGIASGFAAVQGAMALVGGESKEVEQAILKVQAAMALAQGLSGIRQGVDDFKRLFGVLGQITVVQKANAAANTLAAGTMRLFGAATAQTGAAFQAFKAALISSGIGAFIVGLGIGINKLIEFTSRTNSAADAQRELNRELSETANKFTDEIAGIYEEDARLQAARAKAAGATEAEIADITRKANANIIAERRKNYLEQQVAGRDARDAKKALDKAETDNELFELGLRQRAREEGERKQREAASKSTADRKAHAAKVAEETRAAADAALQAEQQTADELFAIHHSAEEVELRALAFKFSERLEMYRKAGRDTAELLTAWETEQGAITAKFATERAEAAQKDRNDFIDAELARQDEQTQREQAYADARKAIAKEEADNRIKSAQAVSFALDGFAALAGEQTAAGKAFAVTSATIQAILGAQQAFTALSGIPIVGPALGAIAAAGAIAAGIANVKKILAVPVPGKGGGGGGGPTPSLGGAAPLSPQAPQPQTTRIDQQSINQMGNATVKAVVVESDITTSQQRITRIQNAATFR